MVSVIAGLSIVAMSFSISASHSLMALTFLLYAIHRWRAKPARMHTTDASILDRLPPAPFVLAAVLFGWLLLSYSLWRLVLKPESPTTVFVKSEASDVFLFLFGLLVYDLARRSETGRRHIHRGLLVFGLLSLAGAGIGIFTEMRLSNLLQGYDQNYTANNRPQHPWTAFSFFGQTISLYRTVGLTNTKLTLGGHLLLILPFLWHAIDSKGLRSSRRRFGMAATLIALSIPLLAANGARSIQLALALTGLLTGSALFWQWWNKQRGGWSALTGARAAIIAVVLLFVVGYLVEVQWAITQEVARRTDHQRLIVWAGAGELILKHPLLGVGPGGFELALEQWKWGFVSRFPETIYYVMNAPDGHAHNDLLHLTAIGGLPAGILFLLFVYRVIPGQPGDPGLDREHDQEKVLRWFSFAMVAFFLAGLFQCYFQDDEVVGLFWALVGYALALKSAPYPYPESPSIQAEG